MAERILVVDDEKEILISCRKILENAGYAVSTVENGEYALDLLAAEHPSLILLDLHLPGRSGLEVLESVRKLAPETVVILFTAYAEVGSAVQAIKRGAFDYLPKPFTDDQLLLAIEQALQDRRLRFQNLELQGEQSAQPGFDSILGDSPVMHRLFDVMRKVAGSTASVLIRGESGTGKELACIDHR